MVTAALGLAFFWIFLQFARKTRRRPTAFLGVVFQAWRRMDEPESQPARMMVETVVRKIAESCRAGTELETDLGLKVFCLIPG